MTDVAQADEQIHEIREILCDHRRKQQLDLLRICNDLRCECGHKSRLQLVQDKMLWFKRMTLSYQVIFAVLAFLTIMATYGLWLARHYYRVSIFGGCLTTGLWPFVDCQTAF